MTYRASITVQTRPDPSIPGSIRAAIERSGGIVEFITSTRESKGSKELVISVLLEDPDRLTPLLHSVDGNAGVAVEEVGQLRPVDRVLR